MELLQSNRWEEHKKIIDKYKEGIARRSKDTAAIMESFDKT